MSTFGPVTMNIAINEAVTTERLEFHPQIHSGAYRLVVNIDALTAADLGIQVSADGTTYVPLVDDSGNYLGAATFAADQAIRTPELPFFRYVKLWTHNGSGADVDQAAARVLQVWVETD